MCHDVCVRVCVENSMQFDQSMYTYSMCPLKSSVNLTSSKTHAKLHVHVVSFECWSIVGSVHVTEYMCVCVCFEAFESLMLGLV